MKPEAYSADGKPLFAAPPKVLEAGDPRLRPAPAGEEFSFSPTEMVKNIPGSGRQAAEQFWSAITNPIDTATAIKNVSFGLAQKLWPGEQDHEQYADAIGQMIVDRYGSVDAALRTLQEDPVGALLDISSLVTAGSGAFRFGAKAAGATRAAETAGKIQALADPFNLAKRGVQKGASMVKGKGAPAEMLNSAVKPHRTIPEKDRAAAIQTALDKQILPTPAGMRKLDVQLSKLGSRIDNLLTQAEETGRKVHFSEVVKPVRELKQRWKSSPEVGNFDSIKKMDKIMNGWRDQLKSQGNMYLSPAELQKIKTQLYKEINFARSNQKASLPVEEVKKAIAKGSRESIEGFVPEIKNVNRQYGELENLRNVFDAPVARIQNRDMMGIGVPIKVSAGSLLTGDYGVLGGALGGLWGAMDAPTNKARLAMALNRWGKNPIATPSAFPLTLGTYQAGGLLGYQ